MGQGRERSEPGEGSRSGCSARRVGWQSGWAVSLRVRAVCGVGADASTRRTREEVVPSVVEKCLGSARVRRAFTGYEGVRGS